MNNDIFSLKGKVAIVTGGNGGIGFGIAKGLAGAGADMVVAARNQEKTEKAVKELQALGAKAMGVFTDVRDESAVKTMFRTVAEDFGLPDILVNNAGVALRKDPQDFTLEEWNHVVSTNLTTVFLCSREVYPYMIKAGGGKIINIGSMTSIFGGAVAASYSASKGGVVQLTKSLAVAWAKDNIQVNAILPGWIHTPMTSSMSPNRYDSIKSRIPRGRWGEPDEIAGAAVFLASSASDYVTGIALPVDGGYSSA